MRNNTVKLWKVNYILAIVNLVAACALLINMSGCGNPQSFFVTEKGEAGAAGTNGAVGATGPQGAPGQDGANCIVVQIAIGDTVLPKGGAIVTCGLNSVLISNGADGLNGSNGTNGTNGVDGQDGQDGQNGADAPTSAYSIAEIIDPCGDKPGVDDEVFLRLGNGGLVWLQVDNGSALTARLAQARDGSWQTTDGSSCTFTLNTVGNQRTIAWTGGSKTWTIQ